MENKKYLDKVIDYLVKGTKIDYENEQIYYPFSSIHPKSPFNSSSFSWFISSLYPNRPYYQPLSSYCEKLFGLTKEEIDYVYLRYIEIIIYKIENGEQ